MSSATGDFRFDFVAPGQYTLTIEASGFSTIQRPLTVRVGQATPEDIQLALGAQSTSISVSANSNTLDTDDGNVSTVFSEKQIQSDPNPGSDLTYVAQTAPGAVMNTQGGGGNFSTFGLPGYSNLFTINGMDYLSTYGDNNKSGATNNSLGANEMQSATVINNGYSGAYGRFAGANVNFVSKSGGNSMHGDALYDWNGRVLNANDFFNKHTTGTPTPRPFDNVNQWAASLGGPLWRNHTFFFVNNEGLRIVLPTSTTAYIPSPAFETATLANLTSVSPQSLPFYRQLFSLYNSAAGASRAVPASDTSGLGRCGSAALLAAVGSACALQFQASPSALTDEWLLSWRIDHEISAEDQAFLRIQTDDGNQITIDPLNPLFDGYSPQPEWQGQFNETHTFNDHAVNQFIGAFQWSNIPGGPQNVTAATAAIPAELTLVGNTFTSLGSSQAVRTGRAITQYQIVDDVSYHIGHHTLKGGENFLRDDLTIRNYGAGTAGTILTSVNGFYNGQVDTSFTQTFPTVTEAPFAAYDLGFYGEDDWDIAPVFNITAAFRVERDADITCRTNCYARLTAPFTQTLHDATIPYEQAISSGLSSEFYGLTAFSLQPRLGLALKLRPGTVLRGGIGNFTDSFPQSIITNLSSNPPRVNSFLVTGSLAPQAPGNVFTNASRVNQTYLSGFAQGATLSQLRALDPTFAPPAYFGTEAFTKLPTYLEYNLELEQSLGKAAVLTINYVGNHGIHQAFQNKGLNAFAFAGFSGLPATAPDSRFGTVTVLQTNATSRYDGVIVGVQHNFSHSFQAAVNYTWSHAQDTVSNNGFSAADDDTDPSITTPQNPYDPHANYGNSDYDTRSNITANYVWTPSFGSVLPGFVPRGVSAGWTISGTVFARSGLPFTVIDSASTAKLSGTNNYGGELFANYTGQGASGCGRSAVNASTPCLSSAQFSAAGSLTTFGDQQRNTFRGPDFVTTDLTILKALPLERFAGGRSVSLGASFYNILNHANFDMPINDVNNSQFGVITRTVSPPTSILGSGLGGDSSPRQIQLTARVYF